MKAKKKTSRAGLDAFTGGVIWGMHIGKVRREDMQKHLQKKEGARPTLDCIDKVIGHKTADPDWRGEESRAGGRPHALSDKEKKLLIRLVFRHRGQAIFTVNYCTRKLKFLKKVRLTCVKGALHNAGRQKSWVPPPHKEARLAYCRWLKDRHQQTLDRFAYTEILPNAAKCCQVHKMPPGATRCCQKLPHSGRARRLHNNYITTT